MEKMEKKERGQMETASGGEEKGSSVGKGMKGENQVPTMSPRR